MNKYTKYIIVRTLLYYTGRNGACGVQKGACATAEAYGEKSVHYGGSDGGGGGNDDWDDGDVDVHRSNRGWYVVVCACPCACEALSYNKL